MVETKDTTEPIGACCCGAIIGSVLAMQFFNYNQTEAIYAGFGLGIIFVIFDYLINRFIKKPVGN
jgi:hypothetical protein